MPLVLFGDRIFLRVFDSVPPQAHTFLIPLLLSFLVKSLIAQTEILVETSDMVFRFKFIQAILSGILLFCLGISFTFNLKIELVLYELFLGNLIAHLFALSYLKTNFGLRIDSYFKKVYFPFTMIFCLIFVAFHFLTKLHVWVLES